MTRIFALIATILLTSPALCADWLAAPSTYTHDPRTAERVNQYTPIGPVYAFPDPSVQSAYRHVQSVIRAGDAADYLHVVEQYGTNPVRPYGEWQFPFRPYSVPYPMWGPQFMLPFGPYGYPPYPGSYPYSNSPLDPASNPMPDSNFGFGYDQYDRGHYNYGYHGHDDGHWQHGNGSNGNWQHGNGSNGNWQHGNGQYGHGSHGMGPSSGNSQHGHGSYGHGH